jgi:putative ABC transport system permease protein
MEPVSRAFRDGWRHILNAPLIPVTIVIAIVIGAGVSTATFALIYSLLLRGLPFDRPDRLVQLTAVTGDRELGISLPELDDWRTRPTVFDGIAASTTNPFALMTQDGTRPIQGAIVSAGFFQVLGIPMLAGRPLRPEDDALPVAVVSEGLGKREVGGPAQSIGQRLLVNGESLTIVGVVPAGSAFPTADVDVWIPLEYARHSAPPQWRMRGFRRFSLFGRLRDGVSATAAAADAARVARELEAEFPRFNRQTTMHVTPLQERLIAGVRPALIVLAVAVGLVVLAVCANVANLLITRGLSRRREIAVRVALGASRRDITLQLAMELAIIGVAAIAGALLVSAAVVKVAAGTALPRAAEIRIDFAVAAFAALCVIGTAVIAAAVPLTILWWTPPVHALREERSGPGLRARHWHQGLVVIQVATSVALLALTSLAVRSLVGLLAVDSGAAPRALYVAKLTMTSAAFVSDGAQISLVERALEGLRSVPGIEGADVMSSVPPDGSQMRTTVASPIDPNAPEVQAEIVATSSGAFRTLGIPVLRGQPYGSDVRSDTARQVVLSETAARQLFPGREALGQSLPIGAGIAGVGVPTVVGVVGDLRFRGLASSAGAAIYLPYAHRPFRSTFVLLISSLPATSIAPTIEQTLRTLDPGVAVGGLRSWDGLISDATAPARFRAMALASTSVLGLLVAVIGLYGVIAHAVSTRTREFAVRQALGARQRDISSLVLRQAGKLLAAGAAIGAIGGWIAARSMTGMLFGVSPADATSFLAAIVIGILVGLTACVLPAWRAASVAPSVVLKGE